MKLHKRIALCATETLGILLALLVMTAVMVIFMPFVFLWELIGHVDELNNKLRAG